MSLPSELVPARHSALWQEIHQQPDVLAGLIDGEAEPLRRFLAGLPSYQFAHFAARGSSDHAATYATYALAALAGVPVALATPSLHTLYAQPPRLEGALVVGISQSGQSPDVVSVLEEGRRQGRPTLAITNDASSPLANAADHVVALRAGEEHSVAATKTYTAQLASVALLAALLAERVGNDAALKSLAAIPAAVSQALALDDMVGELSVRYRFASRCLVLARGFNYASAKELALKLKELAGVLADAASSADFRHGPIALVEPDFPALLFAPTGPSHADMLALAQELSARGGDLLLLSDAPDSTVGRLLRLPGAIEEWLTPLVYIVPGQLLALYIAQARTPDVDQPRGLSKVTLTT